MGVRWRCDDCDQERTCDPLAGDDWGGVMRAVGPDCPDCGIEMDYLGDACDECRGSGVSEKDPSGAFALACAPCDGHGYIPFAPTDEPDTLEADARQP